MYPDGFSSSGMLIWCTASHQDSFQCFVQQRSSLGSFLLRTDIVSWSGAARRCASAEPFRCQCKLRDTYTLLPDSSWYPLKLRVRDSHSCCRCGRKHSVQPLTTIHLYLPAKEGCLHMCLLQPVMQQLQCLWQASTVAAYVLLQLSVV